MEFSVPARNVHSCSLSNDRNGYSVYGVIVYGTPEQQAAVREIRDAVRVRRSMLAAHVIVKGPVCEIPSIEDLQRVIGSVAEASWPIAVEFEGSPTARKLPNGEMAALQSIRVTDHLADIHRRLLEAIDPISKNADSLDATGEYHPHLTVYREPEPGFEDQGLELLERLDIGSNFTADSLHLIAHRGTPGRGKWEDLSVHPLTGRRPCPG